MQQSPYESMIPQSIPSSSKSSKIPENLSQPLSSARNSTRDVFVRTPVINANKHARSLAPFPRPVRLQLPAVSIQNDEVTQLSRKLPTTFFCRSFGLALQSISGCAPPPEKPGHIRTADEELSKLIEDFDFDADARDAWLRPINPVFKRG